MAETDNVEIDPSLIAETPPEVIDHGDGTSTVVIGDSVAKPSSSGFSANLAEELDDAELDELARKYLELIEADIQGREERDKQYAAGLKKTGIAEPAPGGAQFEGASRVTHPILAEAYVDFSASAIKELFPPNGPVRTKIEGKVTHEKTDKAARKAAFMNWQLTTQIRGYRSELERLLTQLPAGGSQFMKVYWDEDRGRINVMFIPIDDYILPYNANNFYDSQRRFHRMYLDGLTLDRRIATGVYRDYDLPRAMGGSHEPTETARVNAKIEGKAPENYSDDVDRLVYEGVIFEQLDGDERPKPYLITIDEQKQKVLALYRNWSEGDAQCAELDYIVDWNFIPWRGAYALGLPQLIGGLSDALTGALRALMDSSLIATLPGALKLKSVEGGGNNVIDPTQVTEIDGLGSDDIRKIAMPLPFPGPSPVLFQLLGFLTSAAKEVVGTAEEKIADASGEMPVGTALALIEQGAKVFSAIHARLHDSQRRVLEIIHRLNAEHLPAKVMYGSDDKDFVTPEDFEGVMDIHPVSDPNIFSETQRFAQIQAVIQLLTQLAGVPAFAPALANVNINKLMQRQFEMMKFPDYQEILLPVEEAVPTNPDNENINLVLGKPVKAFAGQDHQAHLQVHLDFGQSPFFGMSPIMPPTFGPAMLNHIQDHLLNFYQEMMEKDASNQLGGQLDNLDVDPRSTEALARSSPIVLKATQIAFEKIPQIIQMAMQHIQANAPKPPVDPKVQLQGQELQQRQQYDQGKLALESQKHSDLMAYKNQELQAKLKEAQDNLDAHNSEMQARIQEADMAARARLQQTQDNNTTALIITDKKIAADMHSNLIDGLSLGSPRAGE